MTELETQLRNVLTKSAQDWTPEDRNVIIRSNREYGRDKVKSIRDEVSPS